MPDILDISKRKARDIHFESDLGHLMENCFVQSSLSKLQETIVLRVLRVLHVLLCTRFNDALGCARVGNRKR